MQIVDAAEAQRRLNRKRERARVHVAAKRARMTQETTGPRVAANRLPSALQGLGAWFATRRAHFENRMEMAVSRVREARDGGNLMRIAGLANDEGTDFEFRR